MKIIWTRHAKERQKEWERILGISREQVENVLKNPEQIVAGYRNVLIAQTRWRNGLLRVPFMETEEELKIVTIYWTSKVEKYWRWEKVRVRYDPESDVLMLVLREDPPVDAVEEQGGVIVSYGEDGEPVSVEFLAAAARNLVPADGLSITLESKSHSSI